MTTENICFVIVMLVFLCFALLFIGMMISQHLREQRRFDEFMSEVRRLRGEIDTTLR